MTDLEITRLCAEAMGMKPSPGKSIPQGILCMHKSWYHKYDPLHDDAQAMALVKKFPAQCIFAMSRAILESTKPLDAVTLDLNRAICECVAKLKQGESG